MIPELFLETYNPYRSREVENARLETDIEVNEALSDVMKTFHKDDAE